MGVDPWECETPEDALASIRAWVKRYTYIHSTPAYLTSVEYRLLALFPAGNTRRLLRGVKSGDRFHLV